MKRISSPTTSIKSRYDVVVIGSGYGGGVTASRMARANRKVCVLERGKEFLPGEFPDSPAEAAEELQVDTKDVHIGCETALYDLHVNDEISVLVGCGLGGTSLINANVSIQADPRVFEDSIWPDELITDLETNLQDGFNCAQQMLKPTPYPEGTGNHPILKKTEAMRKSGEFMSQETRLLPINVNFEAHENGVNHVGVEQEPCNLCGDCCSGCNYTAKNTVQMTYLPDAKNHGAEIYTQTKVSHIAQKDGKWIVYYAVAQNGCDKFNDPNQFVIADVVVLSAGSLGSTEIMLRSREKGLTVSDQLGHNFTGNGDVLSFAYNTDYEIGAIGKGSKQIDPNSPPGPCITSIIDTRPSSSNYREGMSIEEGVIPGALAPLLPSAFSALAKTTGIDTDSGFMDTVNEKKRSIESFFRGSYHGAMKNTLTSLVMTHDGAAGKMHLDHNRLRITWPGLGDEAIFSKVQDNMIEVTKALGGTFVRNPISSKHMENDQITVHPLGGCKMGRDATQGVVNHKGQVFCSTDGTQVYPDLYIADGSIMPTSLGTNPLLTISAISERNAKLMAEDHGWSYSVDLPSAPVTEQVNEEKIGIQFSEVMAGYFSKGKHIDYETAYKKGEADKNTFEFTLTVASDDLETMLNDKDHEAAMYGTASVPLLSNQPLTVTKGIFNLFSTDPDRPETRLMNYEMKMTAENGDVYYMSGFKSIHDDAGFDMWSDTTTLFITVYKDLLAPDNIFGKGILKIRPSDLARRLSTIKVTNTKNPVERLKYTAKFGKFFAGQLFDTYGGVATGLDYFSSEAPPRKKRVLDAPTPEVYRVVTKDHASIRLTRYKGGNKGPVILSHGLGVSSKIFSMDTFDTNLLEYLVANYYDVWLLDYRVSIALPASQDQSTADQVAQYDYPAAIDRVLEITKAESVQMVVHCYGATTWTMGMLGGHIEKVRSAVISQVSAHIKTPVMSKLKARVYLPELLEKIGINSLTAYVDSESDWESKLFDKVLKLYPIQEEEQCHNPVCRRITFLYGQLYEHDQLNTLTHDNFHEMYGIANMTAFEHLGRMIRKGHVVTAEGDNSYMDHFERMKLPITFIGGAENECFLPEGLNETYQTLKNCNGDSWYKKYLIPNYGHIDCIHGKNASKDVYPYILQQLEETL